MLPARTTAVARRRPFERLGRVMSACPGAIDCNTSCPLAFPPAAGAPHTPPSCPARTHAHATISSSINGLLSPPAQASIMPAAAAAQSHEFITSHADAAEEALQQGLVDVALAAAKKQMACGRGVEPPDGHQLQAQARALNVLIQADFHFHNRLTDLQAVLSEHALSLCDLPLRTILLWGVVAVELRAASPARCVLRRFLSGKDFGEHATDVSRADALALSRLYAVQLLAGLCQDFDGAASWLEAGGAGLSEEQQELLLMEVDEAEALVQEEHLSAWTVQHAAEAGQPGDAGSGGEAPAGTSGGGASAPAGPSVASSVVGSCSVASTAGAAAAFQELGPSVSGVLSSSSSLHPEGSGSSSLLQEAAPASVPAPAAVQHGSSQLQQQQQPEQGEAAPLPAHAAAAGDSDAPTASMLLAAVAAAAAGSEHGYGCSAASGDQEPPSPSLAGWRVADADESSLPDQGGHEDSNPFVTLTGELDGLDAAAAGAADGSQPGSKTGSPKRPGSLRSSNSSSSKALSRAAAAGAAVAPAATAGAAAAAAAGPEIEVDTPQEQEEASQQQEQPQELQQQQQHEQPQQSWAAAYHTYSSWASSKAAEVWGSSRVQGALGALHLQDVPPWELAGGAGLAVLVSYSLYRERRNLKRAAASLASSVAQTAGMALGGLRTLNAMGAAPGTGHVAR